MATGNSAMRVLLIEDDAATAVLVGEMLALTTPAPISVRHVTRLDAALDALSDDGRIDVIVLDLSLPDARGLQALAMLRVAAPRTPVVILSANADAELARQGVAMGAQDYLVKGVLTPEGLRRALAYAIERQRHQDHLTWLAFHDALTGLPNRALLDDRLEQALEQALAHTRRTGEHLAVLFLDLDGFKAVNDRLGHEAGDALLRDVAVRLVGCSRASDTVARLSGDEFVVLLPSADQQAADRIAGRILAVLSAPYTLTGEQATVTASIGISLSSEEGTEPGVLIRSADQAMYTAKRHGKNTYAFAPGAVRTRDAAGRGV